MKVRNCIFTLPLARGTTVYALANQVWSAAYSFPHYLRILEPRAVSRLILIIIPFILSLNDGDGLRSCLLEVTEPRCRLGCIHANDYLAGESSLFMESIRIIGQRLSPASS